MSKESISSVKGAPSATVEAMNSVAGKWALITGASLGFVLAALTSVVLLAGRRVSRHSLISFGPYMLAGALLAVLAGAP